MERRRRRRWSPALRPKKRGARSFLAPRNREGLLVRPVQTQRLGEEDGHLAPGHRAVGAIVAAAASAADSRGGERLDELESEVGRRNVAERCLARRGRDLPLSEVEVERRPCSFGPASSSWTPSSSAPLSSVTVPTILPVVCAAAENGSRKAARNRTMPTRPAAALRRGALSVRTSPRFSPRARILSLGNHVPIRGVEQEAVERHSADRRTRFKDLAWRRRTNSRIVV